MLKGYFQSLFADPHGTPALIRRLLLEQAVGRWKRYAEAFGLLGIAAVSTAAGAYLIGDVINAAYVDKNLKGIVILALVVAVIFMIKAIATYLGALTLARIGNSIVAENQRRMFGALMQQNIGFFAQRHSSEFMARLTTGAAAASHVLNLLITSIGRDLLSLIGLFVVMAVQDPVMSLFSVIVVPPAMLILRKMIRRIRVIAHHQFTGGTRILETLQESVQGIRIVKAFTLEEAMRARIDANVAEVEQRIEQMGADRPPLRPADGGARRVCDRAGVDLRRLPGDRDRGDAGAVLLLPRRLHAGLRAGQATGPAQHRSQQRPGRRAHPVRHHRQPTDRGARRRAPAARLSTARVEFTNVQFSYRPGEKVIRNLSFVAEPGKVTALVGQSGGGKSTILNLILRFYEADNGAIVIDGQSIATVSRRSLRQQVAYVGQDVFLFRGSARDNIAVGRPGATEEEIVAAAKAAHAHDFIMAFPLGYDTPVGEHGLQVAGGERQRIAVARALLKDAPIILLDEATASLDSESEREVQRAIERLCEGRTTIVIAHRLHTITHADRICVVEDGSIVESGRHDELLRKGGRYASFYRLQLKDQEPPPPVAVA